MKNTPKKASPKVEHDEWDTRKLGASEKHVRKASAKHEKDLDQTLGLQTISIRLQKNLINDLKTLAEEDGIGYQPFIRQILMRFVKQKEYERRERVRGDKSERDIR